MAKIAFDELRFVVADDNAHMRRIVRTLLRAFGCREIYEAEDGASGLEAVEAYSPDILITDITMPIFDGILNFCASRSRPPRSTGAFRT
jgi:YesN/AraC family two-component response regulator